MTSSIRWNEPRGRDTSVVQKRPFNKLFSLSSISCKAPCTKKIGRRKNYPFLLIESRDYDDLRTLSRVFAPSTRRIVDIRSSRIKGIDRAVYLDQQRLSFIRRRLYVKSRCNYDIMLYFNRPSASMIRKLFIDRITRGPSSFSDDSGQELLHRHYIDARDPSQELIESKFEFLERVGSNQPRSSEPLHSILAIRERLHRRTLRPRIIAST